MTEIVGSYIVPVHPHPLLVPEQNAGWKKLREAFDEAKRQKRRVINISILVAIITILAYILLSYVILTEVGIALQLPWESSRLWN